MKTIEEINSLIWAWKSDEIEIEDIINLMHEMYRENQALRKLNNDTIRISHNSI